MNQKTLSLLRCNQKYSFYNEDIYITLVIGLRTLFEGNCKIYKIVFDKTQDNSFRITRNYITKRTIYCFDGVYYYKD